MDSKFLFNLEQATIYQAVKLAGFFRIIKFLKGLFLVLFIFTLFIFLYGFLSVTFSLRLNQILLGVNLIIIVFFISFWLKSLFFELKLKRPKIKLKETNLAEFLGFEAAKVVNESIRFAKKNNFFEVNSSILFYFLLKDNPRINFIFSRALLSLKEVKGVLKKYFEILKRNDFSSNINFSEDFQKTIIESLKMAGERGVEKIGVGDLLIALTKHNLIFQEILNSADVRTDDLEHLTRWLEFLEEKIEERKKFWKWNNLIKKGTLAKDWAAGFTVTLDKFSIDLSEVAKRRDISRVVGHQKEVELMERILSREESNNDILLIGEAGTGKKSIIQWLALKSVLGQSLPELNYKRIVALDIPSILTQTNNQEEIEFIFNKIFQEVITAGNVILSIDNFHNYIRVENQPGIIDISAIISPYLAMPQFRVIATTTYADLHKYIERKPAILEFFEKVEVLELSEKETLMVLENLALFYEQKYKKLISYSSLKKIIYLANRYIPNVPFPKKAMALLDEAMIYINSTKDRVVLPKHIVKIISEKVEIPVGEIETKEKEVLINLEKLIHERIINQTEAVKEVSTALRRARTEIVVRKGPMGTFLFLGPSGVGKTETAKALAEIYFGSEKKMIRVDMSEFQSVTDIPRLIGSATTEEDGFLTTQVRENPFSIILLDEIEKAHKNILNLFLQVLDEGHLTDGFGRKVNFGNTIIIATSNAGSQIILEHLKEKGEWLQLKQKILDYVFEQAIFKPEFVNRFDAVVIFQHLTKENLLKIADLMLQRLKKNLKNKNINFIINEEVKEKIVEIGYNPVFGARELKRVIQNKIENLLASSILSDELKKNDSVEIVVEGEEFKLKFK